MQVHIKRGDIENVNGDIICPESMNMLRLIEKSKNEAMKYEWLFHCTKSENLLSIIKSRTFWLSEIKHTNDKMEFQQIDVDTYKNSYYIACFSLESRLSDPHWKEYSDTSMTNGILFGVKRDWFTKKINFMNSENNKADIEMLKIYEGYNEALNEKIRKQKENRIIEPYYILNYGFYKIIYDNEINVKIRTKGKFHGVDMPCFNILIPSAIGIVKRTDGICSRNGMNPYNKSWVDENEVRLKVQIESFSQKFNAIDCYFPKISVSLSNEAFNDLKIKFSPYFDQTKKVEYIDTLENLLPNSKIEVIKD